MNPKPIKADSLVTVDLGKYSNSSNTYRVVALLEGGKVLLTHPLNEDCFIIKSDADLNKVAPTLKSGTERCLDFCAKNRAVLGYKSTATLDALCYYFIIKKDLAANQKEELATLCASIATITLNSSLSNAFALIEENIAVLDDFNKAWYARIKETQKNSKVLEPKITKQVFKIAGFVLAQIGDISEKS
jgi:hypothetical protein